MWAKHGEGFNAVMDAVGAARFIDPNTGQTPTINLMNSADYGLALPNFGTTLDSLIERGTQIAVCDAATNFIAGQIAAAGGTAAEDVYAELKDNAVRDAVFVSAGVVAMTRAQEYGYSLLYAG